ncbi:MAG: excinuclease ABC subunit UvrA [Gemmatimonadota bacterium]
MEDAIRIRGARQHNLKNLDLDLPHRTVTVVTGPSGSGKSSLALDTLFAEGQRRYVESLSTYAKQFLERVEKPQVDRIEGLAPAVAIEQKNPTKSSRSTVGTATEVYDYLRLLWARVGVTHCPACDRVITPDTPASVAERLLALPRGTRVVLGFPLAISAKVRHDTLVQNLLAMGFVRVHAGQQILDLTTADAADPAVLGIDLSEVPEPIVVVDRLKAGSADRARVVDSVQTAFTEGEGEAIALVERGESLRFTERFRCPQHPDLSFLDPTPRLFSFNNPYGSCPKCTGFGATLEYDPALIVPNPARSIAEGAVDPWEKPRYDKERDRLRRYARSQGVSVNTPWERLTQRFKKAVLYGAEGFEGVVPFLHSREAKRYKQYIRVFLRQYQTPRTCPACKGTRLRPEALRVRVGGLSIAEASERVVEELGGWLRDLKLEGMAAAVATTILRELHARLAFLNDVGLGYLTLARQMRTLSGGEAQRIHLANSLGASLVDTLYVLDEPTIGLHPRDTSALLDLLTRLRAAGNTVLMVEHDSEAIRRADHVVELGPASGERGGQLVFQGTPEELESADTVTGRFLSGRSAVDVPERRRPVRHAVIELNGARLHNVDGIDVVFPVGARTVVTGVSGSGKSTLVHDIFYRALERELSDGDTSAKQHLGEVVGEYEKLRGLQHVHEAVLVDQSPIGRTPRSNPVTYIGAWSEIRRILSEQPLARQRGYQAKDFSFNLEGGRCEECKGAGQVEVEMIFMADVFVPCDACGGSRFKREIRDVRYRGLDVSRILDLTVDEAIRFFLKEDRLGETMWHLQQVGLGYLRLGQPAPTLSGGEAQRLKIARELAGSGGRKNQRRLYLLDEPTTGLSGDDVKKLLRVLDRLVDAGHTVVVIEHNLDVIKTADWVIDLGPGAGARGGQLVAMGRPEDIAGVPESVTGRYLAAVLPTGARSA